MKITVTKNIRGQIYVTKPCDQLWLGCEGLVASGDINKPWTRYRKAMIPTNKEKKFDNRLLPMEQK